MPIIGNALEFPSKGMPNALRDLSAKYGDLTYLTVFGKGMLVVGSHAAALDLMEKRSANYSDRTRSTMATMQVHPLSLFRPTAHAGWDWALPVMPYGPWWRKSRKTFHEFYNAGAVARYRPIQEEAVRRFLLRLARDPHQFPEHIRCAFGWAIMRIAYGLDIDRERTRYMTIAAETMATFARTFVPGKYLVDAFPALRFVPAWAPGAGFKRDGAAWRRVVHRLLDTPWEATLAAMKTGTLPPSIVSTLVDRVSSEGTASQAEERRLARDTAAAGYAGKRGPLLGYTTSSLLTFFLAMATFPSVQKQAQAQLDAVVGPGRLPTFDDQPALPYVHALVKETLRWRVVLPLGFSHCSIHDDEYRGYFIPGGTQIIPNAWAFTRDPKDYPDPEKFMPERFLKDGKLNPDILDPGDFGYGRRACPGRDFADATMFAVVSSVLHTFNIVPAKDDKGNPLPLLGDVSDGALS
ncbi:CyP450 monooxygenase [Trametes elegans]|nr:CyP450 monooxygenase [Trametes elegans]